MTRRVHGVALLLLGFLAMGAVDAPGPVEGKGESRAFTIKHKDLEDVVTLIRPALSDESSILIQSGIRTLTVSDNGENLDAAQALIASFDLPPQNVSLNVNLIRASRAGPGPRAKISPSRLPVDLRELTKWLDYELLGGMSMLTAEGEGSSLSLGEEYRIRFQVDLVDDGADKVRLRDFILERRSASSGGRESYVPIFDTVVNLKSGIPYVFGATRGQDSQQALFLTITADIAE